MSDLIERDRVVEFAMTRDITVIIPRYAELSNQEKELCCEVCRGWKKIIEDAPTVDAVPVVHAHWVDYRMGAEYCSNCIRFAYKDYDGEAIESDYCPHCGAKMDEEVNDDA